MSESSPPPSNGKPEALGSFPIPDRPSAPRIEEILDVVDENDVVVRQAPRSEVHSDRLLHRAVHVFVFNTKGELLVQLRSAHKDEHPLCYTSSASGHLNAGESYDEAAARELAEELGLESKLERLVKLSASPELCNEHTVLYAATTDGMPRVDAAEIQDVERVAFVELERRIALDPRRYTPPFRRLLRWYREHQAPQGSNEGT